MAKRIRLAFALLALSLFPQQSRSATLRQEQLNPHPAKPLVDDAQGITIPFEYYRQHIFVTVTVNGHAGLIFLLDTGTSVNILSLPASEQMGLRLENITRAKDLGLGGGRVSVAGARNLDVEIGNQTIGDTLAIVDLNGLAHFYGHRTDGILGFPLLKRFVVEIDFGRHLLTLWPSHSYKYHGSGDTMMLSEKGNTPTIPVTVNTLSRREQNALVEVDTGSDASLMLYPQFAHRSHLENEFLKMNTQSAYGLGGYFPVRPGILGSMTMGNVLVTHFTAFLMQTSPEVTRNKVGGLIGTSVLGSYSRIIFDVPRRRIIFEAPPPAAPWRQASASGYGQPVMH